MDLLIATRSRHKMSEIRTILADVPRLTLLDLDEAGVAPSPEEARLEPYDTFEANARSKAGHFRERSGLPTVADDSGLEVDALGGAPGVRSKRFAPGAWEGEARDRANNEHLLRLLAGVPPSARTARYVCVAVLAGDDGEMRSFRGAAEGRILESPRGEGGFGYDPLFQDDTLERSFAEIGRGEKNRRSHRGEAFRALAEHLRRRAGRG